MKKIILLTAAICSAFTVCASAHSSQEVCTIAIGENKDVVYSSLGEPDSASANSSKEVYCLEDGSTAILQYSSDTLKAAYIVRGN